MNRNRTRGGFGGARNRGMGREAAERRTPAGSMSTGSGGGTSMGGANMNLSIVNGVGAPMPPHVEVEFRRNADELVEFWVNKGAPQHLARRYVDDVILHHMALWKIKRSKDEIGDNDDIGEMDLGEFRKFTPKTFRDAMEKSRDMPVDQVVYSGRRSLEQDALAAHSGIPQEAKIAALQRLTDGSGFRLSQIGSNHNLGWLGDYQSSDLGGRRGMVSGVGLYGGFLGGNRGMGTGVESFGGFSGRVNSFGSSRSFAGRGMARNRGRRGTRGMGPWSDWTELR